MHMEKGNWKTLPFIKAKVCTNRQKTNSMGNENAYGAERNKNVNKPICTNKHRRACIHINTHTGKQM